MPNRCFLLPHVRRSVCGPAACLLSFWLHFLQILQIAFLGKHEESIISKSHFSTKFCSHLSCHINNAHIPGRSLVLSQDSHNKWLQVGCDQQQKFNLSTQEAKHLRKARQGNLSGVIGRLWYFLALGCTAAKWIHLPVWTPATSLRTTLLWYELTRTKCTIFKCTHILRFQCAWALARHHSELHTCC